MALELIDRLRDEADLCRNDGANDIAKLLDDAACAVDYFSAHHFNRAPAWLPCRIKVPLEAYPGTPIQDGSPDQCEIDCDCNQLGAMSVRTSNGQMLGVKPNECQIIGWRRNEKT
jgi:hypothetical protein